MCDVRKLPGFKEVDRMIAPANVNLRHAMQLLVQQAFAAGQQSEIEKNAELFGTLSAALAHVNGEIAQNVRRVRELTANLKTGQSGNPDSVSK